MCGDHYLVNFKKWLKHLENMSNSWKDCHLFLKDNITKYKSHEFQLVQTILMVASSNPMSPVDTHIKNAHKVDLLYSELLLHRNMIVDDVNIIRELIDVCENYKSINVLTMCDVAFMI